MVKLALRFAVPAAGTAGLHYVTMGNDLLDVKANPLVFGDEDSDVLVGADMAFSEAADPLTLSPRALADLMAVEEERDDGQPTVHGDRAVFLAAVDVSAIPLDRSCSPAVSVDCLVTDPVDVVLADPASRAAPSVVGAMLPAGDN
jgi:hypothetical protein